MNYFYLPPILDLYKHENETDVSDDELFDRYSQYALNKYYGSRKFFKNNNLKFLVKIQRNILEEDNCCDIFLEDVQYYLSWGINPSDLVFGYSNNYQKKTFSQKELDNLKKLDKIGKKIGITVGVFDYENVFTYNEVKNADRIIKEKADEIKKHKFSPLEKLLHAYLIVSDKIYNREVEGKESQSQSRSIYGVLNSDKIVCAGFSNYLKAISKELNDPNLKIFTNFVGTKYVIENAKSEYGLHVNNIVYIKDDKYKIDGFYYLDPTWDSDKENKNLLSYFLLEIGQINNNEYKRIIDYYDKEVQRYKHSDVPDKSSKKNIKYKEDFINNYKIVTYASVSKDKLNFDSEKYILKYDFAATEELISKYLVSRQDFKDYIILKETMHELKDSKLSFDKLLEQNAKIVEEDITKTKTFNNNREMFKYLKQHSPHLDIGVIQNALQTVFAANNPEKSKDEVSKMVYDIMKKNILEGKTTFHGDKTLWTECEELIDKL